MLSVQSPCAIVCLNISVQVKDPKLTLFGHTNILHTLIGMGNAALGAAVLYPDKAAQIFRKDQSTNKKKKKKKKKKK